jgi:hypothetical protein
MTALIEITLGLLIGVAGFVYIAENPYHASCGLLLSGFLVMTGFERRLFGKPAQSEIQTN